MNTESLVKDAVQNLANMIFKKDPKAEIHCTPSKVQIITNNPHVQPLADLRIKANGKDILYNLFLNDGKLESLPVYEGKK